MKNKVFFTFVLVLWLLGGLIFKYDSSYYELLNVPDFFINPTINSFISIIVYFLITYSITNIKKDTRILENNDYFFILIINYLANMIFPLMFYNLRSPLLGFIMNLIVLISTYYLLIETKKLNRKSYYFLIPYLVFSIYSFITSLFIWILNF